MYRFGLLVFTPTVLTLIIHVEVWVVDVYTHTPTVLTLIVHVEVWIVDSVYCCLFTQGCQEFTFVGVKGKEKSHQTGVPQTSVETLTQGHHRTC